MTRNSLRLGCRKALMWLIALPLLMPYSALRSYADDAPPTLTTINPSTFSGANGATMKVKLTGAGFTNQTTMQFSPEGVFVAGSDWNQTNGTSATVTLTLQDATVDTVNVWVEREDGKTSGQLQLSTGTTSVCLETFQTGECSLLWQVYGTSATGSSSQSNNSTIPNIMVKLDYQWRAAKNQKQKTFLHDQVLNRHSVPLVKPRDETTLQGNARAAAEAEANQLGLKTSKADYLVGHLTVQSGYTQVVSATNVQPTNTSGTTGTGSGTTSTTSCPGGSTTSSANCTAAIPQQAFVTDGQITFGVTTGVNGQSVYSEFGVGARGSFQYLIPNNKVVTSGGLTYIDLTSVNPHDAVGSYEATGHFRLAQIGHNKVLPGQDQKGKIQNSSDLLNVEAGYQNNRGLQQLMANSSLNTRNRYVARFSINPELPNAKHTQLTMGVEYSGGMNGGPHVVQLFFGTNLNPAKLFGSKN